MLSHSASQHHTEARTAFCPNLGLEKTCARPIRWRRKVLPGGSGGQEHNCRLMWQPRPRYLPRRVPAAPERDPRNHLLQSREISGSSTNCPDCCWAQRSPGTHPAWGLLPRPSTPPALPTQVMGSNSYAEKASRVASAFLTKPWQIHQIWDQLQTCSEKRKIAQGNCATELRPDLPSRTSCAQSSPFMRVPPSNGQGHKQWTSPLTLPPTLPTQFCRLFLQNMPRNCPWRHGHQHHADLSCVITHPTRSIHGTEDPCTCPSHPSACSQHSRWPGISVRHTTSLLTILDGPSVYTDVCTAKEMCWEKTCSGLWVRTAAQSWGCREQHQQSVTEQGKRFCGALLGCLSTDVIQGADGPEELAFKKNVCGLQVRKFSKNWKKH